MSVLIDTNVFVAAADRSEARNARAKQLLVDLTTQRPFTTDHVIIETWAVLKRRAGHHAADRFLTGLRGSPILLESVSLADLERATAIGQAWSDQQFDIVDRTAMAVMERLRVVRVATFDRDFAVYRFGPDRREAFEVLT